MPIAVWMLYASDRLLDARHLIDNPLHTGDLEHRHRFHHRYRSSFLLGILVASVALAVLIPRLDPSALHLYLILGALVAGYFILIHATGNAHRLPKEIAVGIFFASAVFIPTIARVPLLRLSLLPAAALFALLCSLNCLFIYSWEHPAPHIASSRPHPATRLTLKHLSALAALSIATGLLLAILSAAGLAPYTIHQRLPWELPAACAISSTLLLLLHLFGQRIAALDLRAAADLVLLSPLLFLPLMSRLPQ